MLNIQVALLFVYFSNIVCETFLISVDKETGNVLKAIGQPN
jgi:hypothetical protein